MAGTRSVPFLLVLLATLLMFAGAGMAQDITEGLVARYKFTGDALDATDGGADATVHGATLCPDPVGQPDRAYCFDGTEYDYISTPLEVQSAAGTVSAWARVDSFETGFNRLNLILGQWDNLQLGLGDSSLGADGQWVFRFRNAANSLRTVVGPLAVVGQWVHVAGVWTGSELILYLDGEPAATVSSAGSAGAEGNLMIGRHSHLYGQNYWFGAIDDVRVYDRALTAVEIDLLTEMYTGTEKRTWGAIKAMYGK
ncbi:MAG: hypothetical protein GF405_01415 [Candidatus Eisenbacteria bacterium]|nr:hypothetical protein [Candidatus Eisenbacteria bacterium]